MKTRQLGQWLTLRFHSRPFYNRWRQQVLLSLGLALSWQVALPVQAAQNESKALELRVAVEEQSNRLSVGSSTQANVKDEAGRSLGQISAMQSFTVQLSSGSLRLGPWSRRRLRIEPQNGGYIFIDDQWYRGQVELIATSSGILAVNRVDLEQYLYSVVGAEMPANWPLEALKAQAIAARSYVLFQRQSRASAHYDVDDSQSSQVYKGLESEALSTQQAVRATAGQVLTYNGQIIEAVFHSSSGGHTENVEDIWVEALPYLRGVPDYDAGAPVYTWNTRVSQAQLRTLLPGLGNVLYMLPLRMTPQGRVVMMRIVGERGNRDINGNQLRTLLNLRSTLFSVMPRFSPIASLKPMATPPTNFEISGRGFGHGLGLSQWGAHNMASRGWTYQQITAYYYQGATLGKIALIP
ncbi:SpoIID/LytB domain-containing protein [Leptolyngbya sp. FACHB-261]|uniref:SpoIID/LytB domain-containing protein n=1 Tax=Leptolyngbya sp. FACHB-261 TaxID=2692806 RepID=UPI001686FCB1|nr:SpoIID/LytB domain-containing protein [Leptolyngbya sp. FACHB-261]MBD2104807.1 SpoIID/LytB domain-containing protein [Leptolyngbya sp. FACHB-261]